MSNPYRDALLALYTWANEHCTRYQRTADVMHRTRVLLTHPEPTELTDEGLLEMWHGSNWFNEGATLREFISIARAAIAADRARRA